MLFIELVAPKEVSKHYRCSKLNLGEIKQLQDLILQSVRQSFDVTAELNLGAIVDGVIMKFGTTTSYKCLSVRMGLARENDDDTVFLPSPRLHETVEDYGERCKEDLVTGVLLIKKKVDNVKKKPKQQQPIAVFYAEDSTVMIVRILLAIVGVIGAMKNSSEIELKLNSRYVFHVCMCE